MDIDVNSPIDDLLESWVVYSQKLIYSMLDKTDLDEFNKIKLVLKTKGVMNLEIHNAYETEYVLHYNKHGGLFKKHIAISK